jgi:hypothetical protein
MKPELQNYAVIIPVDNSYIKFKNKKINSLQIYDTAQNYTILHKVVQSLSQHNLTFISSVEENNDSNRTCRYVHDLSMYKIPSKCNGS